MIISNAEGRTREFHYPADEILRVNNQIARLDSFASHIFHRGKMLKAQFERLFNEAATLDDAETFHAINPPSSLRKVLPATANRESIEAYAQYVLNPSPNAAAAVGHELSAWAAKSAVRLPKAVGPASQATRAAVPVQAPAKAPATIAAEFVVVKDSLRAMAGELDRLLTSTAYKFNE